VRLFQREPLQLIVAQEILPGDEQRPHHELEKILGSGYVVTVGIGNAAVAQLTLNSDYYAAVFADWATKPHSNHSDDTITTGLDALLRMRANGTYIPTIIVGQDPGSADKGVLYIASVNYLRHALHKLPWERNAA
jgi:hypothetical protein